jgi:hypothetical protein
MLDATSEAFLGVQDESCDYSAQNAILPPPRSINRSLEHLVLRLHLQRERGCEDPNARRGSAYEVIQHSLCVWHYMYRLVRRMSWRLSSGMWTDGVVVDIAISGIGHQCMSLSDFYDGRRTSPSLV